MTLLDVVLKNEDGKVYEGLIFKYRMKNGVLEYYNNRWEVSGVSFNGLKEGEVKEVKENPFERVGSNEKFYCIEKSGNITEYLEEFECIDNKLYSLGNYFRDEETAKECAEFIKNQFKAFRKMKLKELEIHE